MYNENMLAMLSQIEKEDRERRFKHSLRQTPRHTVSRNRFLTYLKQLGNRIAEQPVTIQPRATSEVPGV